MTETQAPDRRAGKPRGIDLPFWRSMPPPVLITFLVVAAVALATVVYLIADPPSPTIAIGARKSPPSATLTHNVGPVQLAAILNNTIAPTVAPCDVLKGVVVEGGAPAVARVTEALKLLCLHVEGSDEIARALGGLAGAHIRFATFARTGDTSATELAAKRVLVNIAFAQSDAPVSPIAPLLAHEGYHLAHAAEPRNARQEIGARKVELEACRLVIDIRSWPRGCTDAQSLLESGEEAAAAQLVKAGYEQ